MTLGQELSFTTLTSPSQLEGKGSFALAPSLPEVGSSLAQSCPILIPHGFPTLYPKASLHAHQRLPHLSSKGRLIPSLLSPRSLPKILLASCLYGSFASLRRQV